MTDAESDTGLGGLVDAQAALRRVAMLVAGESSPEEVFGAVTEEAARVLRTEAVGMLRFEPDGTATVVARSDAPWDPPALGTRVALDGENIVTQVFRTGKAARVDDWANATGSVAALADELGVRSCVATPIVVEGRTWGTLIAATNRSDPLPADTQVRTREFTDLVATAIANAEARSQLARLANEQAALRRVATLVARGVSPEEVFRAVAAEVCGLFGSDIGDVLRFEEDGTVTVLGVTDTRDGAEHVTPEVGERVVPDPGYGVHQVRQTNRSARFDTDNPFAAHMPPFVRSLGIRSAVASPVIVDGKLWGAITTVSLDRTLAPDVEQRLNAFTELVATAVANGHAREQLTRLVGEQAALRRVATRVASGATPEEVFPAVADEVRVLFGGDVSAIVRFESDGTATVLGDVGGPHNTGKRVTLDAGYVVHTVRETGRSARFDTGDPSSADASSLVRTMGIRSAVASPIVVEGQVWGAITSASRDAPLAPAAEQRLTEFTDLVATAVANTQARNEVIASRARIVAASDDARRRIERDLHDGAQQRLVSLGLELRIAAEGVPSAMPELEARLDFVADEIDGVIDDLREMSRGIHPAVLSEGGLTPAIEMLARRAAVRVELDLGAPMRFPEQVEVAAYFVVSEALTNTAKHGNASRANVVVDQRDGRVRVSIEDDGDGGAQMDGGSGLAGLRDRVEALGGSFRLSSPPGQGTVVAAELPVGSDGGAIPT